jgi:catechol 2,3-dioxygenase-like lactoylglutathione lyase family enzyme
VTGRLGGVSLIVPDYDVAIAFFQAGLGFRVTADLPQGHKRWVTVAPLAGGTQIVLARADGAAQVAGIGAQGAGRVWLFYETDDFDRDHAALLAAGAVFEEVPRVEPYGKVAVWRDPWGNRWDLIQPV